MNTSVTPASRVRWHVLALLFVVTTVNYADRATISVAGPAIQKALALSPVAMGYVFSAFAWAYVAAQLPGGWLLDRFGSKRTYLCSILLWSVFTLLQGTVGLLTGAAAVGALVVLRMLVGAAEAPAFPANSRITSAWFPNHERGLAAAIFNAAQYAATAFFTPLMAWLVHEYGWRSVFYVMGATGVALAGVWARTMHGPREHPGVSAGELAYIEAGGGLVDLDARSPQSGRTPAIDTWACIRELLGTRMLMGVYLGQYCINTLTYFFLTWFPVYLVQERGMGILKAGFMASLPAVAGLLGGVTGGWLSDRLLRQGYSLARARKIPIVAGLLLSTSIIACNYVRADAIVVVVMSLAFFGKGVGALGWAVVSDTSPREAGGLSGALFNTFGNAAGITTPIAIGYIVQGTGSFAGALVFVGANAALAIISYLVIVGDIRRVTLRTSLVRREG